jgi:hypothetical protein
VVNTEDWGGSTISRRLTLEGGSAVNPTDIDLSPIPVDSGLSPLVRNPPARAAIKPSGTFEIAGISGPRRLTLMRAPPDWTLKSVLMNGIDVTDMPIPFGGVDLSVANCQSCRTRPERNPSLR